MFPFKLNLLIGTAVLSIQFLSMLPRGGLLILLRDGQSLRYGSSRFRVRSVGMSLRRRCSLPPNAPPARGDNYPIWIRCQVTRSFKKWKNCFPAQKRGARTDLRSRQPSRSSTIQLLRSRGVRLVLSFISNDESNFRGRGAQLVSSRCSAWFQAMPGGMRQRETRNPAVKSKVSWCQFPGFCF